MTSSKSPTSYTFGGFTIDSATRKLTAPDGKPIDLRPRAFETLFALVENSGETLSRAHLLDQVWPDSAVDENNLNQAIASLRKVLEGSKGQRDWIQTVPGRGYQFAIDVAEVSKPDETKSKSTFHARANEHNSIAVLPFVNISGDTKFDPLADGITDSLIAGLANFPEFEVLARSTVFALQRDKTDARQLGELYDIRYVVEGALNPQGDQVRLVVQLIDTSTGLSFWADTFDHQLGKVFEIQDTLVRQVLYEVHPTITQYEIELALARPSDQLTAWDLYRQASNPQFDRDSIAQFDRVISLLKQSLDLDPDLGVAHAHMSLWPLVRDWMTPSEDCESLDTTSLTHTERALSLCPNNPYVMTIVSNTYATLGQTRDAVRLNERSLTLQPNTPYFQCAAVMHQAYLDGGLRGGFERLMELLNAISEKNFDRMATAANAVHLATLNQDFEDGALLFDRVGGIRENYPEMAAYQIVCLDQCGNTQAADRAMTWLLDHFPKFEAHHYFKRNIERRMAHPDQEEGRHAFHQTLVNVQQRNQR